VKQKMAGAFSQIYIQTVFAVKNRDALIQALHTRRRERGTENRVPKTSV
jgi:hypothetical protein